MVSEIIILTTITTISSALWQPGSLLKVVAVWREPWIARINVGRRG